MELGLHFISAMLRDGRNALREAINRGVTVDYLKDNARTVYEFVLEYVKTYDDLPTALVIEGKINIKLPDPQPNPSLFFIDEVLNRKLHDVLRESVLNVMRPLEARDPRTAYTNYETGLRDVRKLQIATARTDSLMILRPEFSERYKLLESGYRGIQTPWPTVNDMTLGYWPEDFVLYAARVATGKTWILVMQAEYAWSVEGRRVLFVTTEMSRVKIMQRWVALHFKLAYDDVRKGRLSPYAKINMDQGLDALQNAEGFYIIGGDFDFRLESLEGAIEECQPDIVYVDGIYLLKIPGDNRFERAAEVYDEMKRMAKRYKIPIVASTQLNRQAKVNKSTTITTDTIALSDAGGWNADLVWGLVQTDDMKKNGTLIQKPLKFREGLGDDIEICWDFAMMNFSEVPTGRAAAMVGGAGSSTGAGQASGVSGSSDPNDPLPF